MTITWEVELLCTNYTLDLDDKSAEAGTIVMLFGKFKYHRMLMGLKYAPGFTREVMENVLHGIEGIVGYYPLLQGSE